MSIGLIDISHCEPDEFISSDEIEQKLSPVYDRLKLPYGRIEMQTGIKSRGIYPNKKPSDISTMAAQNLFRQNKVKPDEIDLLIHASVCRDFLEPSTASVVHHKLGLKASCISFDLSNACLGVVSAIQIVKDMINSGSIDKAMIVTGENSFPLLSKTINTLTEDHELTRKTIKKYFANFTIGSAGVAIVIGKADENCLGQINSIKTLSDTCGFDLCMGDGSTEGLVMETNSELLMKKGVALAQKNWETFSDNDFDHYICHQVGINHRKLLYEKLDLDISKDYASFEKYGNTGSAALPLTLALAIQDKQFKTGDDIALLGIGSGIHTTMMSLKWN